MALVVRCPVIVAPAMNMDMYSNAIVSANMDVLREHGHIFCGAASPGGLLCGDEGIGRLADPDHIVKVVEQALNSGLLDYDGVCVLVTAGPTHEPIDPVRYITNRSLGEDGLCHCRACRQARGACRAHQRPDKPRRAHRR